MQPARSPEAPWDGYDQSNEARPPQSSQNPTIREYEARRCHVCRCKYPPFGFGPPLTPLGARLWACSAHYQDVRQLLRGTAVKPAEKEQPSFL